LVQNKEVKDRAEIVQDVLFGKSSGTDADAILAVAQLTTALCNNQCAAVVDAGPFVFFKIKTESGEFQIFHKRLTVRERKIINDQPSLLADPYGLLKSIENVLALDHDRAAEFRKLALGN
jgi:hypothetical protein